MEEIENQLISVNELITQMVSHIHECMMWNTLGTLHLEQLKYVKYLLTLYPDTSRKINHSAHWWSFLESLTNKS